MLSTVDLDILVRITTTNMSKNRKTFIVMKKNFEFVHRSEFSFQATLSEQRCEITKSG